MLICIPIESDEHLTSYSSLCLMVFEVLITITKPCFFPTSRVHWIRASWLLNIISMVEMLVKSNKHSLTPMELMYCKKKKYIPVWGGRVKPPKIILFS